MKKGYNPCTPVYYPFGGENPYLDTNWAFHADDIFYFFGSHVCVGDRECQEKNSPNEDILADLSTIHAVLHTTGKTASELDEDNILASKIGADGDIETIDNYWRQQKNLYQKVIPDLWEREMKNWKNEDTANGTKLNCAMSFILVVFLGFF